MHTSRWKDARKHIEPASLYRVPASLTMKRHTFQTFVRGILNILFLNQRDYIIPII